MYSYSWWCWYFFLFRCLCSYIYVYLHANVYDNVYVSLMSVCVNIIAHALCTFLYCLCFCLCSFFFFFFFMFMIMFTYICLRMIVSQADVYGQLALFWHSLGASRFNRLHHSSSFFLQIYYRRSPFPLNLSSHTSLISTRPDVIRPDKYVF